MLQSLGFKASTVSWGSWVIRFSCGVVFFYFFLIQIRFLQSRAWAEAAEDAEARARPRAQSNPVRLWVSFMGHSPFEASGPNYWKKQNNPQCNRFVMIETFKLSPSSPLCQIVCLFAQQATPEYQVVLHCAGCGLTALYSPGQNTSHTICLLYNEFGGAAATCQHDFSLCHLWPSPHCFHSYGKKLSFFIFEAEYIF